MFNGEILEPFYHHYYLIFFWEYLLMQLNGKKVKYKNGKERSKWQLFAEDLTVVFVGSGCHNKIPSIGWLKQHKLIFSWSWRLEVGDQGASMVEFWWELSSWLADGHLLAVYSHGGECKETLRRLFFYKFMYLFIFIFGCVGSSFLCEGFLQLRQLGATLHRGVRASHRRGLSCCGAQAPDTQAQ